MSHSLAGLSWPVGVIVAALLVSYLALFPGLFALCLGWLAAHDSDPVRCSSRRRSGSPPSSARTYFWSGFPWVLLGYSQTTVLPIAQIASIVGVFGVSALVAAVGAALAYFVLSRSTGSIADAGWNRRCCAGHRALGESSACLTTCFVDQGRPVRVALIQGNIPQDQKWDDAQAGNILNTYLSMTREAARQGAQLVIWPESSTPFPFQDDRSGRRADQIGRAGNRHRAPAGERSNRSLEQVVLQRGVPRPEGRKRRGVYQKMHLVPFGEFVPLQRLLFFVGPLVEAAGAFTPGAQMVMLPTSHGPISTAICYEIVFPGLVRESIVKGSQLLTTITNDAWYGHSSAPYQHFVQASMRAIEQGRYLARAANTGISGIVDPYGRVVQQSEIFERTVMVGDVRMLRGRRPSMAESEICSRTSVRR